MKSKYLSFVVLAIILVYTAFLFSGTFGSKILDWDDNKYITENPFIKDLSFNGIKNIFSDPYFSNYHPLTTLSWAVEFKLFGTNPRPYHIDNLLLHLINVMLVFFLMKLLLKEEKISLLIALFFAIHPMHVESVAWISERKDLLYALFFLGSLILYLKYLLFGKKNKYYFLSLLLFIASLLSKSMAVTLPIVLFLLVYFLNQKITKKDLIGISPFVILSVIVGVIAIKTQTTEGSNLYMPVYSFIDRIFLLSYAILFYIFKIILPVNLSALHPYPDKLNGFLPLIYYFSFIILLLIVLLVYKWKNVRKSLIFGLLFFLITISVVLQLMPVGQAIVAERYTYIPYLGLFILFALIYKYYAGIKKPAFIKVKPLLIGLISVFILFFSWQTYSRTLVWKNTKSLYTSIMKANPENYYGYFLMGNLENQKQNYNEAETYYKKSLRLNPNSKIVLNNLGYICFMKKDYQTALSYYDKALTTDNRYVDSYINRGNLKTTIGDNKGALNDYNTAISLNEKNFLAYLNRAILKSNMQDFKGSIDDYNKVIELDPGVEMAYLNKGKMYLSLQNYNEAINCFTKAISLRTDDFDAFFCRANAYYNLNKFTEAIKDYDKTIGLAPMHVVAFNNRGLSKFSINNKTEGCQDIKKAMDLGYQDAGTFYNTYCK